MIQLTENAVNKVKEIIAQQEPKPTALRVSVMGGVAPGSNTRWPLRTVRCHSIRFTSSTAVSRFLSTRRAYSIWRT